MFLFGVVALWGIPPKRWLQQGWWLLGLAWVASYAISWFWSTDKGEWSAHLQVKLPFLILPLSFALLPRFDTKELRLFTLGLVLIISAGAIYSLSFFWTAGGEHLLFHYKYSHVLPTPVYNDHISYSTAVALTIAWVVYYLKQFHKKWQRILLMSLAVFLVIYLHILAAKTGLLAFYFFTLALIVYVCRKNVKRGLLLFAAVIALFFLAYLTVPTLRERIGNIYVTWRSYSSGERTGIYSDAGRIISYDIALRSIASHPLIGVGAGDVLAEMADGYQRWYPQVPKEQYLWPHNQWLTCFMVAGIPCALLFTLWLIAPLRQIRRNREGFYFLVVWSMLLVPLMIDVFLEVQFGVAVFLIFLLLQRKVMLDRYALANSENTSSLDQFHPDIPAQNRRIPG